MVELSKKRTRCPSHPGSLLKEFVVDSLGLSKVEIADHLGISRQHLYDLLNEAKPVTPQMAVRLGKLVGNSPEVWVRLQTDYDLWHAMKDTDVSQIPTLTARK